MFKIPEQRLYKVYVSEQQHPIHHPEETRMDLTKLSKGGKIFAGAAFVYFIASFLNWYSWDYSVPGLSLSTSVNAWGDIGFLWGSLWALLFLAAIVVLALPVFGVKGPKLPAVAFLAVAALATVFTLLKLVIGEPDPITASFGIYLAVLAAAGATFGGFLMFTESGGSVNDLKDINKLKGQFSGGSTGGDTPPPPPPPPGMTPPPPPPPPAG
jgi:hypothetical protein